MKRVDSQALGELSDSLITTLRGIVLVLDTDGRITLCNPYFEELTGYAPGEILGRDWFDAFIPEDERDKIREVFSAVLRQRINDGYTNAILTKSGEQLVVEWHSKTLDDSDGRIIGMLCTGYDVTDRVANATALKEAKEEAERSTLAKTRFLAAASHDLRQPLQSLGLYLSVLRGQLESSEQQETADKMRTPLEAMGDLLDALLDISKLDGGSVVPQKRDFSLQGLVHDIVTDNVQQAESKGLKLESTVGACVVHTDPSLLARVIENFVTNAIRYTDRGQITVQCQCHDGIARIAVRDTGSGIPKGSLDKIFDEYYQLDNPVRDREKGLGLGLAIVRHIARLLDHTIDVTSVLGEGSTFSVEVPLGESEVIDAEESVPMNASRTSREPSVLCVDDDPAVLDATTMLLKSAGMRVHSALNGDDALELLRSGLSPDVIVSDYRLPGFSGIELIRRIRAATAEEAHAVLMTGDTSASAIEAANLTNCTVLRKPVDTNQLISLIESHAD